ncbi:MAG: FAD-dependent oxidoreductase [Clostridiales bacterium]|nr:FAD-dependent oxidoreductase [Clostridiales bacterium]
MKKFLISLITMMLFGITCSYATYEMDNLKYVSQQTANEMWDIETIINERTGIIELKHEDKMIYMQLGRQIVKQQNEMNRLFMNIEGYLFKGDKNIEGYPFILDDTLYLPANAIYDFVHEENEYDIIVVGCEPEGVAAAVSSARMGAKVLLIGQEETPGGLLVHGMLNTLDMNRQGDTLLTQGIFEEFFDYIGRTESFDVNKAEKFFLELINSESNLTYIPNIKDFTPVVEEKVIKGVEIKGMTNQIYYAQIVIDATKDGDICALAGIPYYKGMEDINVHDTYMAVTLVFKLAGVDWEELGQDVLRYQQETGDMNSGINDSSVWAFGKWCYANYTPLDPNMKLRGLNIGRQDDGTILINALQILGVDGLNKEAVEDAEKRGAREIENILAYLKTKLNSFANAQIAGVADELYIRETRHIKGEYTVQVSELLEGIVYEDAIAAGSYPVDIQTTSVNDSGYVIGVPDCYTIPYRSIVPLEIDNLYIVGKAASYSSVAAGSIRVVPVGMVVGETAGIASIYAIKNNVTPRNIIGQSDAINAIQKTMIEKGGYLPQAQKTEKICNTKYYEAFTKLLNLGLLPGGYSNDFGENKVIAQNSFINLIFRVMPRMGIDKDVDKLREKVQDYFTSDELTYQKAAEILLKLDGKKVKGEKAHEQAFKAGLYSGLKGERIIADNTITNEVAWQLIYDFLK